jgi:hypothetical protein
MVYDGLVGIGINSDQSNLKHLAEGLEKKFGAEKAVFKPYFLVRYPAFEHRCHAGAGANPQLQEAGSIGPGLAMGAIRHHFAYRLNLNCPHPEEEKRVGGLMADI